MLDTQHAASDGSYSGWSPYSQSGLSAMRAIITTYVTRLVILITHVFANAKNLRPVQCPVYFLT